MKLFFCPRCSDVVRMFYKERKCRCGLCSGYYKQDGHTAVITNGIGIGVSNSSFRAALYNRPEAETDKEHRNKINGFDAWVTPVNQPRIEQINTVDNAWTGSLHLERVAVKNMDIVQSGLTMCGIDFWGEPDIYWSIHYAGYCKERKINPKEDILELAKHNKNVCKTCQQRARRLRNPIKRIAVVSLKNF